MRKIKKKRMKDLKKTKESKKDDSNNYFFFLSPKNFAILFFFSIWIYFIIGFSVIMMIKSSDKNTLIASVEIKNIKEELINGLLKIENYKNLESLHLFLMENQEKFCFLECKIPKYNRNI